MKSLETLSKSPVNEGSADLTGLPGLSDAALALPPATSDHAECTCRSAPLVWLSFGVCEYLANVYLEAAR